MVLFWGFKVIFKVVKSILRSKMYKKKNLRNKNKKMCNTSFSCDVYLFFVSFCLNKLFLVLF